MSPASQVPTRVPVAGTADMHRKYTSPHNVLTVVQSGKDNIVMVSKSQDSRPGDPRAETKPGKDGTFLGESSSSANCGEKGGPAS